MQHPDDVTLIENRAIDANTAWQALIEDTGAFVTIVDLHGTIRFAGTSASAVLREVHPDPVGRTLTEIFGEAFAAERIGILQRILATGKPERLRSMVGGVLLTTTYRHLPGQDEFLLISRAASLEADYPETLPGADAVFARTHHLGKLASLTERELELLHHIAMGRSSEETAQLMHRSTRTVEWHRASLGQKLDCVNRVQLARIAVRAGLAAVDLASVTAIHRSCTRHPAPSK